MWAAVSPTRLEITELNRRIANGIASSVATNRAVNVLPQPGGPQNSSFDFARRPNFESNLLRSCSCRNRDTLNDVGFERTALFGWIGESSSASNSSLAVRALLRTFSCAL